MTPLFEIPGRSVARETWRECLHAPQATHVTVYGASGCSCSLGPPPDAADSCSPHYLGRELPPRVLHCPDLGPAAVVSVCEAEWREDCLAWKELRFEADLVLAPGTPPRAPKAGDCLQVFGFVGMLLEFAPLFIETERQRAEYRVRVE